MWIVNTSISDAAATSASNAWKSPGCNSSSTCTNPIEVFTILATTISSSRSNCKLKRYRREAIQLSMLLPLQPKFTAGTPCANQQDGGPHSPPLIQWWSYHRAPHRDTWEPPWLPSTTKEQSSRANSDPYETGQNRAQGVVQHYPTNGNRCAAPHLQEQFQQ